MSELVRQDKMRQRAYRLAAGALRNRADLVDTYEKAKEVSRYTRRLTTNSELTSIRHRSGASVISLH